MSKCWKAKHFAAKIKKHRTSYTSGEASTGRSSVPFFCISLVTMTTVEKQELLNFHRGADIGENTLLVCLLSPHSAVPGRSKPRDVVAGM